MSTEAQIHANRQNAQKSTGPRTSEGKSSVSKNAVKHGLFAAENVISCENQAEFDLFREEMLGELAPVGVIESMLAGRIVSLSWRLQRAGHMQNQAIDVMLAKDETDDWQEILRGRAVKAQDPRAGGLELILGWATNEDFSHSKVLERLMMYERRIENSMLKMMKELERRQLLRQRQEQDAVEEQSASESGRPAEKEGDLKKQSQFVPALMGATSIVKKDYGNIPAGVARKNKANQSQFYAPEPPKGVGKREKSFAAATC